MFFGFKTEVEMRKAIFSVVADKLVQIAVRKPRNVCSLGKVCVGSIDGETYQYQDGTTDNGRMITTHRAEIGGHVFAWGDE